MVTIPSPLRHVLLHVCHVLLYSHTKLGTVLLHRHTKLGSALLHVLTIHCHIHIRRAECQQEGWESATQLCNQLCCKMALQCRLV